MVCHLLYDSRDSSEPVIFWGVSLRGVVGRFNAGVAWKRLNNGEQVAEGRTQALNQQMDTHRSLTATYGQQEDKRLMEKTHTHINTQRQKRKDQCANSLLLDSRSVWVSSWIFMYWLYRGEGGFGGRVSHLWQHSKEKVGSDGVWLCETEEEEDEDERQKKPTKIKVG